MIDVRRLKVLREVAEHGTLAEAAEADVAAFAAGIVGTVRVAGFATGLAEIAAPAAAALRDTHPRLTLVFEEQEAPGCFSALARRDIDIALSMASRQAPPPDDPRFHVRPLRSDVLDAVLPETHPLAALAAVPLAALASEPFVGPPDGTSCHDVTVTGCAAAGFAPGFAHRSLDFYTTMALVGAGLGVALVSYGSA